MPDSAENPPIAEDLGEGEAGKQGEDYYLTEGGLLVFTAAYHLKRGYCCGNGCRHCPYGDAAGDGHGGRGA